MIDYKSIYVSDLNTSIFYGLMVYKVLVFDPI